MSFLNVFNIMAVPDPELRRALNYLAQIGSGSVISAFTKAADPDGKDKAEWADGIAMMVQMAAEEEVRRLRERFDELERQLIEALQENEERLREAREELQEFEASVLTITVPDGTVRKVYRDGDRVRFEDGTFPDPALIDADQVSDNEQQWAQREAARDTVDDLERRGETLRDRLDRVQGAAERLDEGPISQDELEELRALAADASAIVTEAPHSNETEPAGPPDGGDPVNSFVSAPAPGSAR